jgi:hypothetical protein
MGFGGVAVGQRIEIRALVVDRDGKTLLEPSGSEAFRVLDPACPGPARPPGSAP